MKKTKRTSPPFNWSRHPSREGVSQVFLADPQAMTSFGKSITKDEFCNSIATYNKIMALEQNKRQLRDMLYFTTLAMLPFFFFIYNIFIGVSR